MLAVHAWLEHIYCVCQKGFNEWDHDHGEAFFCCEICSGNFAEVSHLKLKELQLLFRSWQFNLLHNSSQNGLNFADLSGFRKHALRNYKVRLAWHRNWIRSASVPSTEGWRATGTFRTRIPRWVWRHNIGYFSLICKEGEREEQERKNGTGGEGRTETEALNLDRCDIPEKNNTASSCYWWRRNRHAR